MTFKWLPDAELDPHPRLTWLAECGFDLTVLALYRKEEILPPDYRLEPGTLVVSNHQRDADVPILTTVLCRREGLPIRWPLPFFASREDFFQRGFLEGLLYHWPRPLRRVLGRFPLAWFFRIVRSVPMRRVREFTLNEAFRDLPGNSVGSDHLNARGRREADEPTHGKRRPPGLRFWGLRRLDRDARRALAPGFRATVAAQLEHFAELLDAGRVVYFAPEGTISEEGRLGRMRAGVLSLVRMSRTPPPILPAGLSYDVLGPGRLRVIVKVGSPWQGYNEGDGIGFNAMLERKIRELYAVTASHLLSRFLVAGPSVFPRDQLADWLCRARERLRAAGIALDPVLQQADCTGLAAERLGWLKRKRLVEPDGMDWRNCWPSDARPGWNGPAGIVRYLDNALADCLHALAPGVELEP